MTNFIERFFLKKEEGQVTTELRNLSNIKRRFGERFWDDKYLSGLEGYLRFALECGLDSILVLHSCFDLALTLDPFLFEDEKRVKEGFWNERQLRYSDKIRGPRVVEMKLNLAYFVAIASGIKKFEGRAYDPTSEKRYEDLRRGDQIVFTINRDSTNLAGESLPLGFNLDSKMICAIGNVYFSPTVHGMFEFCPPIGSEFQPMINGPSELLELQRAGVYYSFPGYVDRIEKYGFLGIEMLNPKVLS